MKIMSTMVDKSKTVIAKKILFLLVASLFLVSSPSKTFGTTRWIPLCVDSMTQMPPSYDQLRDIFRKVAPNFKPFTRESLRRQINRFSGFGHYSLNDELNHEIEELVKNGTRIIFQDFPAQILAVRFEPGDIPFNDGMIFYLRVLNEHGRYMAVWKEYHHVAIGPLEIIKPMVAPDQQ